MDEVRLLPFETGCGESKIEHRTYDSSGRQQKNEIKLNNPTKTMVRREHIMIA